MTRAPGYSQATASNGTTQGGVRIEAGSRCEPRPQPPPATPPGQGHPPQSPDLSPTSLLPPHLMHPGQLFRDLGDKAHLGEPSPHSTSLPQNRSGPPTLGWRVSKALGPAGMGVGQATEIPNSCPSSPAPAQTLAPLPRMPWRLSVAQRSPPQNSLGFLYPQPSQGQPSSGLSSLNPPSLPRGCLSVWPPHVSDPALSPFLHPVPMATRSAASTSGSTHTQGLPGPSWAFSAHTAQPHLHPFP